MSSNIDLSRLKGHSLFKNVSEKDLYSSFSDTEETHRLAGEVVFRDGESYHRGVYFVAAGKVLLTKSDKTMMEIGENDFLGLSSFLSKTMYSVAAIAQTDCSLFFIPEVCICKLMGFNEEFRHCFFEAVRDRLRSLGQATNTFMLNVGIRTAGCHMSSPVVSVKLGSLALDAIKLMKGRDIGCLLVINRKRIVKGLLTFDKLSADLAKYALSTPHNFNDLTIDSYIDTNPKMFPVEYPIVNVLKEMQVDGVQYAVITFGNKPIGIVSQNRLEKDILKLSCVNPANTYVAQTLDDLKAVYSSIYRIAKRLASFSRVSREVLYAVSSMHTAILKRVFQFTADDFADNRSFRLSDYRYTFLILGSGARSELDLQPVADFAFILDDNVDDSAVEKFREFLAQFFENLETIGYQSDGCEVKAQCANFVKRYSEWTANVDERVSKTPVSVGCFSCVMDMSIFAGDATYIWKIKQYIINKVAEKPSIMGSLVLQIPAVKVPVSRFGSFIVEKGGEHDGMLNLRHQAMCHLVNITRLLSVYAGINDTGTIERLEHLSRMGIVPREIACKAMIAFDIITETIINEQLNMSLDGKSVTCYINPDSLSLYCREQLKRALQFLTIYASYGVKLLSDL